MRGRKHNRAVGRQPSWLRRGAAAVEMAIVSPILLAMLFGIVEYGWVFMLQSNVTNAARDACRVGILPYADNATADAAIKVRFASAIAGTGLTEGTGYSVQITRATGANNVQTVTVTARVPWAKASLVGGGVLPNPKSLLAVLSGGGSTAGRTSDMVSACSMMKESTSGS